MNLVDHFLVSMPGMDDPAFKDTVIYVCEHNESGAMGVVINQASDITVSDLFERIELDLPVKDGEDDTISLTTTPVLNGGPVQHERGFVLHEPQTPYLATIAVGGKTGERALTTSRDVLEAVSKGQGPDKLLVTLGYSGWSAGQLETEVARNDWLTIPAGSGAGKILWNTPLAKRKDAAIRLLGIDPVVLTPFAGHA
jgi:putative transcriptional regulator